MLLRYNSKFFEKLFSTNLGVRFWVKCSLLLVGGRSAGVRHQEAVKASSNLSTRHRPFLKAYAAYTKKTKKIKTNKKQKNLSTKQRPFLKPSAHAAQPL